jgi:hypothetical protein
MSEVGQQRVRRLHEIHDYLKSTIAKAQADHKKYYDRGHRPSSIQVGDRVYVKSKHYRTLQTSHKLEYLRNFGPYTVKRKINDNAFKLELPKSFRAHPVLPVSVLTKLRGEPTEPTPVQVSSWVPEAATYVPERFHGIGKRFIGNRQVPCALVEWEGFPNVEDRTWQPISKLEQDPNYKQWLNEYRARTAEPTVLTKRQSRPSQRLRETL